MAKPQKVTPERPVPQIADGRSAEMRRQFMEEYFRPIAERMFEKDERIDAVMIAFAQYWNDEADDAVHDSIVPLVDRRLKLEDVETEKNAPFYRAVEWDERTHELISKPDRVDPWSFAYDVRQEFFGLGGYWDNGQFITAFASYTKEDCTQDTSLAEAYLPYALFVRGEDGIDCRVVAKLLRPHLEDRMPAED